MTEHAAQPLLVVSDLVTSYDRGGRFFGARNQLRAVDGVSLTLEPGETVAVVGESGCGKTTLASSILGLVRTSSGQVRLDGHDVTSATRSQLRHLRRTMQIVLQDPLEALDPRKTVGTSVGEGLVVQSSATKAEVAQRTSEALASVGLSDEQGKRFPHELSGGQLQRACLARALIVNPKLLVCDEPLSALDVSIQAQIVNLLVELQRERGLAYLFISHDLSVVRHLAHRVLVMYLGRVVESGSTSQIFADPRHPYTKALLASVPKRHADGETATLRGEVTRTGAAAWDGQGCAFAPRCPSVTEMCTDKTPVSVQIASGHVADCWHVESSARSAS